MALQELQRYINTKGFTLIEVLVALVLLSAVAVAVFDLYSRGFRSISDAEELTTSAILATTTLEEALARKDPTSTEEYRFEDFTVTMKTEQVEDSNKMLIIIDVFYKDKKNLTLQAERLIYEEQ